MTVASLVDQHPRRDDAGLLHRRQHAARRVQCTGDAFEYGASGTAITSPIPNTDPAVAGSVATLTATRWNVYGPAGESTSVPVQVENLANPLTTTGGALPLSDQPSVPTATLRRLVSIRTLGPMVGDSDIFLM